MSARPAFLAIVEGWTFADSVEMIGEIIEETNAYHKANKSTDAEREIVIAMISRQICMGIDRGDFDFCYDAIARRQVPTLEQWRQEMKEALA